MGSSVAPGWPSPTCSRGDLQTHTKRVRARSALDLYADLYEGGIEALKKRIHTLRDDNLRIGRPLSELDRYFVDHWGEVPDESGWDDGSLLFVAARRLEGFVLSRVEDVRLGFWGELVPWDPSRAYKPVQSWRCPDLRSAKCLQFYFWMTDAGSDSLKS